MSGTGLKGAVGEFRVWQWAERLLPRRDYVHFHDVWLPTPMSKTQIDHVFVSRGGVFVVETENYEGWIHGTADNGTWTQTFANGTRHEFRNPLRQNDWHVRVLARVLQPSGITLANMHSVVAFVGSGEFKTRVPINVRFGEDFAHYIRSFAAPVLSQSRVDSVRHAIAAARIRSAC